MSTCVKGIYTRPVWIDIHVDICVNGFVYISEKDINPKSRTYNKIKVKTKTTRICNGECIPHWRDTGNTRCENCITEKEQTDGCEHTRWIEINIDLCNKSPNWVIQNYFQCFEGNSYSVLKDTNPCSPSYNQTTLGILTGDGCENPCVSNWINKFPLETKCVLGVLFIKQEDGCGHERWQSASTDCNCIPMWSNYIPYTEECHNGISEILQTDNCGNLRWISGGNACE